MTVAPGPAYKRQRSHCHLCCQCAMKIWIRLTATAVSSSCGWDKTAPNMGEVGQCSGKEQRYNSTAVTKSKTSSTLRYRLISSILKYSTSLKCLDLLGLWGLFFEELLIVYLEDVVHSPSFCKFVGKVQLGSRKKFPRETSRHS